MQYRYMNRICIEKIVEMIDINTYLCFLLITLAYVRVYINYMQYPYMNRICIEKNLENCVLTNLTKNMVYPVLSKESLEFLFLFFEKKIIGIKFTFFLYETPCRFNLLIK